MALVWLVMSQLAQSSNDTNVLVQFYGMGVGCGSIPDHSFTGGEVLIDDSTGPRTPDLAAYIVDYAMGGDDDDNNPSLHGFQTGSNFVAVLSGTVPISVAGSYTFTLTLGNADTATVLIDGATALTTGCSWGSAYSTAETLTADDHLVHVIFADDGWSDTVRLEYSGPDTAGVTMLVPTVPSGNDGDWTCLNTCGPRSDNECDDGGAGAEFSLCAIGTDCVDCGPRLTGQPPSTVVPSPPPPPPTPRPPLGDGAWLLSDEGESCDAACAASGAVCNLQRLLDVTSAYEIEYVAEQAGTTCTGGVVGWGYASNPGICSHGGCCGDADGDGYGDCEGICAWGSHADRSCSATNAHYARLCPCGDPQTTATSGGDGTCDDTCVFASDDDCDDGGPGAEYSHLCDYGTDCDDCGTRAASPPSPCTPDPYAICFSSWAPVCGSDGVTYSNTCVATAACQLDPTDGACSSGPAPPPSPAQIYGSPFEGGHLKCVGVPADWNHGHPSYGAATGECRDDGLPVSSVPDQMTVLDLTGRGLSAQCLGNCNWRNCHDDDDMQVCYEACYELGLEGCCQWRSYGPDCVFVHGTQGTQTDGNSDTFAALFSATAPTPDPSPPPPPPVVAGACTPEWGDCTAAGSWCCDDAGQRMRQNEYYSQCRQECPSLYDQHVPWECAETISGPAVSCADGWTWAGGSCFQAFARGDSTAPTFDAANEACGAHVPGATLAKIESAVHNDAASDAIGSASEYIIGLRTAGDGSRYWADGTALEEGGFEAQWHWDLQGEECVRLVGSAHHWHARGWDDWACEAYAGYVCSYVAAEAPPSAPSPAPAEQGCVDIDVRTGATDFYFDGCAEYAGNSDWCTFFDDSDFTAAEMCCACGGGEAGFVSPPPPPSCVDSDTQGQLDIGGDGCSAYIVDWFCGGYWDDADFSAGGLCCICGGGVQNHGGDPLSGDETCSDNEQALVLPSIVQLLMEQFFGGVQCLQVAQLLGSGFPGGPGMAEICQADRAQLDQWLSAGLSDYPAIGALLGAWTIPDTVQNVATDLCAGTCAAYGVGPCASTEPPAPPMLPSPTPPPPGAWDEQRCADECRALGYCCGDHTVGSNQLLSCSQACMIRVRGSSAAVCTAACDEERGCSRTVNGHAYGMCGSCEDLDLDGDGTLECVHGVQSTQACHVGCGLGDLQQPRLPPQPPSPTPPPSPEPSPPPPPHPSSPVFSLPSPPPPDGASVAVVLVAAGDVGDYDAAVQLKLRNRLAAAAAVDVSRVALSVEAASVRLAFSVSGFGSGASAEADAASVGYALKTQLESGDDASALLGVSVEESPLVSVGGETVEFNPSPPPPGTDAAAVPLLPPPPAPLLPGLDAGESALSADEGEDGGGGGGGTELMVVGALALALALLALGGACIVLRRAKRGSAAAGGAAWPRSIVASQPLPNVVAAQVAQLPPLVSPPVQGTIIQAEVAGTIDSSARPAYARLASMCGSSSDIVATCMGSNDVELAPVVSPLTVTPTRLPLPVGAAPPLETKDGGALEGGAALKKDAAGTSIVSV